jgi:hypothetical protein
MADEIVGNIYEVLTIITILDYTSVIKKGEDLFWNEHPKGVLIEPDITIGKDKDSPRLLLLVSHTNAESASHHKFWRNIGEFVDARIALGTTVSLANIVFDSGQKRKLAGASDALFDGFIEADRKAYGKDLLRLANDLAGKVERGRVSVEKRIEFVRNYLKSNPKEAGILKLFAADLENVLNKSSKHSSDWFGAFMKVQSSRPAPRIPKSKHTFLRRGLGRLLPIENENELRKIIQATKSRKPAVLPNYFQSLDLSTKSLRGEIIKDKELLELVELLAEDEIVDLWKQSLLSSNSLRQACNSISLSSDFPKMHKFVCDNFAVLSTPQGLKQALLDCFNNPDFVLGQRIGLSNPTKYGVWLFDYLMTIIKAHSGKQQGYGYTKLGDESGFRFEIAATAGIVLSPFLQRRKNLRDDILTGIAKALSLRKLAIGHKWLVSNQLNISGFYLRGLFEDKIYKMAAFDPLFFLIADALKSAKLEGERFTRMPTYLTTFTGKGTATVDAVIVKNTVIMWQTAYAGHPNDKSKELMGRIGMLRVTTDTLGNPIENKKIKKAILLIDGTWSDSHIKGLVNCGFDAVFYPDEIDDLVKAIV